MTIIEIPQGYYSKVEGTPRDEAVAFFTQQDETRKREHPTWAHRPTWFEIEVPEHKTAPIGYVWYITDAEGVLQVHSANYDTSG